ncbi:osmoprotectant transport system ATP-binding protein [Arthrobacter bambusae]|uniref:Osmoprotectant transport system ATP-binding protein n=1 Tax=Arthrobacter bambusae TaxID=1338426 RepID=A0ABV2P1D7_9MICC
MKSPEEQQNRSGQPTVSVRFEDVSKRYADGTMGADSLELDCPAGKITVFVGPSGCGKTTSLRMINRMITPTSGRILIGRADVSTMNESALRREMGYVIQNAGLFPHRTILDNIATVPVLLGTSHREARVQALGLMERVGLDPAMGKRYPYQLSGGQQQRVGVARALAANPPVLLMDEPFSAVDPVVRGELQSELLRLQQEIGKTIVFVTHDMDEAVRLADQIVVFQKGGTIAQVAAPEVLLTAPASEFVRNFTGGDSGVKWLSLMPSSGIVLSLEAVVDVSESAAGSPSWRLLTDSDRGIVGWLRPGSSPRSLDVIPCRRTFTFGVDNMRAALDSALLSPAGLAAAVDASGNLLGLADLPSLEPAIRGQRSKIHV